MKYNVIILILLGMLSNQIFAQSTVEIKERESITIGDRIEIESKILNETRTLNIYLPNGYSTETDKKYPVIYLLDGSMDEDFIHIAGIVQFGSFFWINMLPESIVVGISNVDRKRDFCFPTNHKKDKEDFPTAGGSIKFISFIENELQPFIEKNYKTDTIRTLIGQSFGGLLATEILFKKPELFDNYVIVSPSLWWDSESLLNYKPAQYYAEKSIYIAVGKEGEVMERTAKELYDKLNSRKKNNNKLYFNFLEEQSHGDALHLAVYDSFEKVFKKKKEVESK